MNRRVQSAHTYIFALCTSLQAFIHLFALPKDVRVIRGVIVTIRLVRCVYDRLLQTAEGPVESPAGGLGLSRLHADY